MKTHQNTLPPEKTAQQGSTLTVVLIIMMLTSFMAASLLTLGSHEKDFTYRRIADVEGRHVLESAVEIAMAELQQHFREAQSVTNNAPSITLPASLVTRLVGNTRYVTDVRITNIANRQFRDQVFVDAQDPDTVLDPHRGSFVNISEWIIQAEADVNYRGQTRQMRAAQSFQVRESPFFTHAILYNMDLEFHPGPAMIINGPVHSNGRIWAVAQNSLHFLDRVSATEGIHIGGMMEGKQTNWSSGYLNNQTGRRVWFNTNGRSPDGAQTNSAHNRSFANLWDRDGNEKHASAYFDSRSEESGKLFDELGFTGMTEFLANWFDGNVAMGSLDAPIIRSQFIPNYVADDGNGNRLNFGYALIEPLMSPLASDGTQNPFHKGNGEREKFAFKSGLNFEVRHMPGFDAGSLTEDQNHWRRLWEPGYDPVHLDDYGDHSHYRPPINDMNTGNLHGQSGFISTSGDNSDFDVKNSGLFYENGDVTHDISTKKIELNRQNEFAHVEFPPLSTPDVYFSYLVHVESMGNQNQFHFGITQSSDMNSIAGMKTVYIRSSDGNYAYLGTDVESSGGRSVSGNAGGFGSNNTTYLVVGLLSKSDPDGNYDSAEILINPEELDRPLTGWQSTTRDTGLNQISRLFFKSVGANANFSVADIRIGRTYQEVVGPIINAEYEGATDYWLIPQKVRRSNAFDLDSTDFSPSASIPLFDEDGDPLLDDDGNEMAETVLGVAHDPVYIHEDIFHDIFRARIYDEDDEGRPVENGGLYDKRDLKPQDLISMDMGAFKSEIIETTDLDRFQKPLDDGGTVLTYNPANEFNGVTYFQFPLNPQTRLDNIVVAQDNFRPFETVQGSGQNNQVAREDYTSLSLFIHNAEEIPNPAYNSNRAPGFTLATNARVYLHGSYNADGDPDTGSLTEGDGSAEHDALAAVAADTVTFLSENFVVENSKQTSLPSATFTEVNAAVMSGILPTNTADLDSRYRPRHDYPISGGSHNYHRFLESFSGITFRYRGSMVAFYESELARSPQEQNGNTWYNAPRREYGFYEVFGTGAQPPGTPMARTFFKMDFRFE